MSKTYFVWGEMTDEGVIRYIWSLCEMCYNAYGFCEWSNPRNPQPVPGWEAIETKYRSQTSGVTSIVPSYIVIRCPKFAADERYKPYIKLWTPDAKVIAKQLKLKEEFGKAMVKAKSKRRKTK